MILRIYKSIRRRIKNKRKLKKQIWFNQMNILPLNHLKAFSLPYIPWTGSAMLPGAVTKILNDIIFHNRKIILELGSGISTYYIAAVLKDRDGILYSVDHDIEWIKIIQTEVKKLGLDNKVIFIHAPLVKTDHFIKNQTNWYDVNRIIEKVESEVDLLIVDGPPAYKKKLQFARFPAVPALSKILKTETAIILDDIQRKGEKVIVKRWAKEFGLSVKLHLQFNSAYLSRKSNQNWNFS